MKEQKPITKAQIIEFWMAVLNWLLIHEKVGKQDFMDAIQVAIELIIEMEEENEVTEEKNETNSK
jgi:hypothetical protein